MDDDLLVSRAISGDLDSFGRLYDAYFARIYDFSWRMLRDADQAGEATRAIFLDAARNLKGAQKASSFEAWIFGRAHARLVAQAGAVPPPAGPAHEEGFGAFDAPDPCRVDDPRIAEADPELPCDVWEASASLSPRDYSLLDLHLRQKIDAAELAQLVGVARSNAALMLERLELAAGGVIATYVLARRGTKDCEELRQIVGGETFPPLTNELRTRIDTHAAQCPTCRGNRALPIEPLQVFAALSPVAAPFVLKGEVWRSLVGLWPEDGEFGPPIAAGLPMGDIDSEPRLPAYAAATALPFGAGGGGAGGDGGGGIRGFFGDESRRNMMLFAAAAGGMLIVAFVAGAFALKAFGSGGGGGGGAATTRTATAGTATSRTTLTPGVSIDTATARPSATLEPEPTDTSVPPPPDTPTPVPAAPSPTVPRPNPTSTPNARTPRPTSTPTRRAGG